MLSSIFINFVSGLIALSVSSGIVLHDSRFDKVFATIAAPTADTSTHDLGQAVSHELHIHGQSITGATDADPGMKARTHRKSVALPHVRHKPIESTR